MIDDVKDIDDVIHDIMDEDEEKDFFEHHKNLSEEEKDAYELGVIASSEEENNPFDEESEELLFKSFKLGWDLGHIPTVFE